MPSAATIRKHLEERNAELDDLRSDLATVEAHRDRAATAVHAAVRSDADTAKREALAAKRAAAEQLVHAQHGSIAEVEAEVRDLEAQLAREEHEVAVKAAEKRVATAEAQLAEMGQHFRELVEGPQRQMAEAFIELEDATIAARDLGVNVRKAHLARHVDFSGTGWARKWLQDALVHVGDLVKQLRRETARQARDGQDGGAPGEEERAREHRKRLLLRERARREPGAQRERRLKRLEAEVGEELDREQAEPVA